MPSLLDVCHEILQNILCQVYPEDLAALAITCRSLNGYIRNNRLLWKSVYLMHFDCPPAKALTGAPDDFWETELKRYVRLDKILESPDDSVKRAEHIPSCRTIIHLLNRANPDTTESLNHRFLHEHFSEQPNLDVFMFSSSLYEFCGSEDNVPHEEEEGRQLSAKLHSLYGVSRETRGRTRSRAAHPFARARVYDLRNYNTLTSWGPFMANGRFITDWEKIEAIMIVLGFNLEAYSQHCLGTFSMVWNQPFEGSTPDSYVPVASALYQQFLLTPAPNDQSSSEAWLMPSLVEQPEPPLEAMDPYGVTGMWRRVVCFLDYRDFYSFNFPEETEVDEPRPPISTQEAIRLIVMKMRVTKLEKPGEHDGQELPVVHFSGFSRSVHSAFDVNTNSKIRGTVRLTCEGEVRWTTLSVFHGEARWRSEGIQVGGLRSARGVFGSWFDKDYDPHGPAGPTAFWKLTDGLEEELGRHPLPREFL